MTCPSCGSSLLIKSGRFSECLDCEYPIEYWLIDDDDDDCDNNDEDEEC
jgi:hypothetical protein